MGLQIVNLMQRWKIQLCLLRFGEKHEQNKTTANKVQRARTVGGVFLTLSSGQRLLNSLQCFAKRSRSF